VFPQPEEMGLPYKGDPGDISKGEAMGLRSLRSAPNKQDSRDRRHRRAGGQPCQPIRSGGDLLYSARRPEVPAQPLIERIPSTKADVADGGWPDCRPGRPTSLVGERSRTALTAGNVTWPRSAGSIRAGSPSAEREYVGTPLSVADFAISAGMAAPAPQGRPCDFPNVQRLVQTALMGAPATKRAGNASWIESAPCRLLRAAD